MIALVDRMLLHNPASRPTVGEVHGTLMGLRSPGTTTARAPLPAGSPRRPVRLGPSSSGGSPGAPVPHTTHRPAALDAALASAAPHASVLRGKGLRLAAGVVRPAPGAPTPGRGRALLGKLLDRLEERGAP